MMKTWMRLTIETCLIKKKMKVLNMINKIKLSKPNLCLQAKRLHNKSKMTEVIRSIRNTLRNKKLSWSTIKTKTTALLPKMCWLHCQKNQIVPNRFLKRTK
jgi:hypothetical protein